MFNSLLDCPPSTAARADHPPASGDLRPEYLLLIACVRFALDQSADKPPLRLPDQGVSWPRFIALAERHQVLPLARFALPHTSGDVPARVQSWLDQRCKTAVAQNLSLAAELVDLLEIFQARGISAVPFKGPALAAALYGNLSLRQVSDLDIFVSRGQLHPALEALQDRGYVIEERFRAMPDEHLQRYHKDIHLTHPESSVHLDLHWSACEPTFDQHLSSLPVCTAHSAVLLLQRAVPIHPPEDLFLLLSIHGLRHRWETLKWVCDLLCLLRSHPHFNWRLAIEKARAVSRLRMLLLGVALVRELANVPIPGDVLRLIDADATLALLCRQIYRGHDSDSKAVDLLTTEAVLGRAKFDVFRLLTRDTFSDRTKLFLTLLGERMRPSPADKECILIPAFATSLYWLIRPLRILRVYGLSCTLRAARNLVHALAGRLSGRTQTFADDFSLN